MKAFDGNLGFLAEEGPKMEALYWRQQQGLRRKPWIGGSRRAKDESLGLVIGDSSRA
ncbi:hypothetical protein CHS0354_040741 [Potamilus streckersoni]|uniref:Uncharacterized protein n=1 Tax=Potamilus streckersoni TaxID=2493646 RepID=A0AAE0SLZ3_9BIVA|nr:hypothetical protein CHS0354_040741 [Potamilus streckersoni]